MGPFAKYWGLGRRAPGLMYTRHRMSQRSTDTSVRIHYSLLQCYYLPVNVRCLRYSLSVTDSGNHSGTPFEASSFCGFFAWQNFTQNFLRWHLKENDMLKILAACHSGAPFQPGALRTCVPCLMVNPALLLLVGITSLQRLVLLWQSLFEARSDTKMVSNLWCLKSKWTILFGVSGVGRMVGE